MRVLAAAEFDPAALREQRLWTDEQFAAAAAIVKDVRERGIEALREWTERLDGARPKKIVLGRKELHALSRAAAPEAEEAIKRAARQIERFAREQLKALKPVELAPADGVNAEVRITPLDSAGAYVPGGRFPLVSSALMCCIPARAAGVGRLVAATPPDKRGSISPEMALALRLAGADELLLAGGAQAVAALAFGVEGLEPVDKIAGPGNVYVTAAKHLVSPFVGVDMLAGPSEICIIADDAADPELVAADLLAQAEHDPRALALLLCDSAELAEQVNRRLESGLAELPDAATAGQALERGAIVVFEQIDAALEAANRLAPEHLELHLKDAGRRAAKLRNFGSLFVGETAAEVLGDYSAGINHTLPTSGAAKHRGGLSVLDFVKLQTVLKAKPGPGSTTLFELAARLADFEGLSAHARAARLRIKKQGA